MKIICLFSRLLPHNNYVPAVGALELSICVTLERN